MFQNAPKCSIFAADLEIKCSKVEHLTVARPENDHKLVAAARELRDRWLEKVNSGQHLPAASGKYNVSRIEPALSAITQTPLLEAA